MKKKIKDLLFFIPLTILVIIILLSAFFVLPSMFKEAPSEQYIEYKDDVSDMLFYDADDIRQDFSSNYKLMFYLSADCGECIKDLPILQRINEVFCKDQNLDMYIMWEDKIPLDTVKHYNLQDNSFSLKNVSISSTYSSSFLLDASNIVIFSDNSPYENVLSVVMDLDELDLEVMQKNAAEYIINNMTSKKSDGYLIYFSMPGCKDCEQATPIIEESHDITERLELVRIERDLNSKPGDIVDKFGIFKSAFSIDWYPSFAVVKNGKIDVIRQVEISDLHDLIVSKISS